MNDTEFEDAAADAEEAVSEPPSVSEDADADAFEKIAKRHAKVSKAISDIESGAKKLANGDKILSYLRFLLSVLDAAALGDENAMAMLSDESCAIKRAEVSYS